MISLNDNKFDGPISDPQIADVFSLMKRETLLEINCCHVGKIESYNSLLNTATVSIGVKKKLKNGKELEYPTLEDCPVFMLYGGTASITMPISSGDGCLILFNDRCMDDWFLTGAVTAPTDKRAHALSDGIVLVGIKPMTKQLLPIPDCLSINAGLKKVSIKNQIADLQVIVKLLLTALVAHGHTALEVAPGSGTSASLTTAINAPLIGIQAQFDNLLQSPSPI